MYEKSKKREINLYVENLFYNQTRAEIIFMWKGSWNDSPLNINIAL